MPYPVASTIRGTQRQPIVVASDWWAVTGKTAVAVYQPVGAASLAASYSNLANPGTYDAAEGTAPTFDAATGWTFNGSDQYLATGVVPGSAYTMLVRFSDGSSPTGVVAGESETNAVFQMWPSLSGNRLWQWGTQTRSVTSGAVTSGVMGLAGPQGYYDGSANSTAMSTYTGTNSYDIYMGARHGSTGAENFFDGKIQAIAIYSDTLTGPEVAALTTAMNAL